MTGEELEEEINQNPNYIAEIDGVRIHFQHIKGQGKISVPLLITHGWPGSFIEMGKLIAPLTTNPEFSFDLIIPSIPGFGFSQKIQTPGCNLWFISDLWNKLIIELGYKKVLLQGGDFGAAISTSLALKHPENLLGLHLNYIPGSYFPFLSNDEKLSEEEIQSLKSAEEWYTAEGAYSHQQRTKPLTLGYGLNDSPVGSVPGLLKNFMAGAIATETSKACLQKMNYWQTLVCIGLRRRFILSVRLYNENSKVPLHF